MVIISVAIQPILWASCFTIRDSSSLRKYTRQFYRLCLLKEQKTRRNEVLSRVKYCYRARLRMDIMEIASACYLKDNTERECVIYIGKSCVIYKQFSFQLVVENWFRLNWMHIVIKLLPLFSIVVAAKNSGWFNGIVKLFLRVIV